MPDLNEMERGHEWPELPDEVPAIPRGRTNTPEEIARIKELEAQIVAIEKIYQPITPAQGGEK